MRFGRLYAVLRNAGLCTRFVLLCVVLWIFFVIEFQPWQNHRPRAPLERGAHVFWAAGEHVVSGALYYCQPQRDVFDDAEKYGLKVTSAPPPFGDVVGRLVADPKAFNSTPPQGAVSIVFLPAFIGAGFVAMTISVICWCLSPLVRILKRCS